MPKTNIFFVGAGSGAVDLITVRGMHLLEQADVVVWAGSLVNEAVLSYCKKDCMCYDSARLTLEETNAILVQAHQAGKCCVRLHTGDPSLFGAIREQMALLDAAGIAYEIIPGVSSMFAAAASLKRELTVPELSQTVIISRMEGRTPVPAREHMRLLAAHGATMVLFLSTHMISALTEQLLAGGAYTEQTPCAVVYKASWHDEKIVYGTLSDIAEKVDAAGITKTALILVGDFLGERYTMSKLYDARFSTEYRVGKPPLLPFDRMALVCFSEQGKDCNQRIQKQFSEQKTEICSLACFGTEHESLHDFCAEQFCVAHAGKKVLVVFIGATGIAVRAIAPFIASKQSDPAVLSIDDAGHFVIALLSGHLGGANDAAHIIAHAIGALPVITTSSDVHGVWACDVWAKKQGFALPDLQTAKKITAAVLAGRRVFAVGIGCKHGTDFQTLRQVVQAVFAAHELDIGLVYTIASIDIKRNEPALQEYARSLHVPFVTFSAHTLQSAEGVFSASDFVLAQTGVDCVCERAAVLAAKTTADWLLVRKSVQNGITVAIAVSPAC